VKKKVHVVSTADQVELFRNGKSLGPGKQSSRFLFTFENVEWQPGPLRAVGLDAKGNQLCETERQTAGEAVAVKLTAMTGAGGFKADGADVALIEVEVVDAAGRRCPTNLNIVDFQLSGPAEWRGGIAQGPDNYILAKSLPVECGVNRVLFRSTPSPGKITLTATSGGLKSASVEIISQPVIVTDGLATVFPDAGQSSRLLRGPTPAGASFKPSRIAVPVAFATAGANANRVNASFDDDETTSWANNNQLADGWISYELSRPATLSEVTMKLTGWRQRSYPIRITVEDQEVYRGSTPRSLGYVTLPLKRVTGKSVKISLINAASAREGFNITELENQQNAATGDERAGSGTLSIVEAEFYESVEPQR
jgi:beta-galactosidase